MTAHSVVLNSGFNAANDQIPDAKLHQRTSASRYQRLDAAIEVILPYRNIIELSDSPGAIRCLSGSLWLTRNRDSTDHVIAPGHTFHFKEGEKIVVQSMEHSRLTLSLDTSRPLPWIPCP